MNLRIVYGQFIKWLPALLVLLFYTSEALSKYSVTFLDDKTDIQRLIKGIVLVFLGLSIIKPFKNIILPMLLFIFFCLGQFFIVDGFNSEIIVSFSKFIFPIFLFLYFNKYIQDQITRRLFFQTFEWLITINGVLIFLGFFLGQELFQTYEGPRFG
ncbi:hypothetical protein, partial [Mesoflavibacter zeaxanthinifaciens]|uniref:hypothetical protein n=1 Tax=Mesoflavibacter zeaxanthinifaciens TaxID=393060 RepID=UPI003A8EDC22